MPASLWASLRPGHGTAYRVRITGDVRTRDVAGRAALFLEADSSGHMVVWASAPAGAQGTQAWRRQELNIFAPAGTGWIGYGVQLQGGGTAEVRRLRVDTVAVPIDVGPLTAVARAELDAALDVARQHSSMYSRNVWSRAERAAREAAAGARTPGDVHAALLRFITVLGDRHAYLMSADDVAAFVSEPGANDSAWLVRAREGGVGYLNVPTYLSADTMAGKRVAAGVLARMADIAPAARCGWVVDLRENGGGTYPTMLAVLRPFLGREVLGGFVLTDTTHAGGPQVLREPWRAGEFVDAPAPPELALLVSAPVAVLTASGTGSAGEIVTIAFRGRPRTRSFGAPTAGLTQAGVSRILPSGAVYSLSAGWYADRTGRAYRGPIPPDREITAWSSATQTDRVLDADSVANCV